MGNQRGILIGDAIRRTASRVPSKTAVVFKGARTCFKELNEDANRVANAILTLGVKKGDKVAILSRNCYEYVVVYFGLAKSGAVMVPLNTHYVAKDLVFVLNDCEANVLILGEDYVDLVNSVKADLPIVKTYVVLGDRPTEGMLPYRHLIATGKLYEPTVEVSENDDVSIMYTSGTTGKPKGAISTHRCRVQTAQNCLIDYGVQEDDITFLAAPMFHYSVLHIILDPFVTRGATCIILPRFDVQEVLSTIEQEKVTQCIFVPTMIHALLQSEELDRYDLTSLRKIGYGGSPMPVEVTKQALAKFPWVDFMQGYGATETGQLTVLESQCYKSKLGQTGRAMTNVDLRVVDASDNDVRPGEVGEMVTRGPHVIRQYLNRPEANATTFRGGWFHTGDMARLAEDGYLTIVDRKTEMIISGGEHVYPQEVEEVLYGHPAVLECAVFGIPDEKWVEAVCAAIVVRPGCEVTEGEIMDYCRTNLAVYKRPKRVQFMESLQKTASGKIQKQVLREPYWRGRDRKI